MEYLMCMWLFLTLSLITDIHLLESNLSKNCFSFAYQVATRSVLQITKHRYDNFRYFSI